MRGPKQKHRGADRARDIEALFSAFAKLKTKAEVARFLTDLATPAELEAFAERWRIARLLNEGGRSYRDIAEVANASTTTVARVARFLRDEDNRGYRLVLDRL